MPRGHPKIDTIVAKGDRRASLEAIRGVLAQQLDDTGHKRGCECDCGPVRDGRVVAIVARTLADVIRELDSLPTIERVAPLDQLAGAIQDELAQRRADRGTAATGS